MCDIFPELSNCCLVINLRIGMLIISIIGIMTGSLMLAVIEHVSEANMDNLKNITEIKHDPRQVLSRLHQLIPSGVCVMAVLFMAMGFVLMFATLADQEGFVQIFVWVTFLNVIIGFIIIVATAFECTVKPVCILSSVDWLTGAIVLVLSGAYLFLWIYFISVANSYVLQVFS